jgi:hypothetical protein
MIRLRINPAFADLLQLHRLDSYPAVMQIKAGELIEKDESRDVRRLQLDDQVVYLKPTRSEKTTSAFESYGRGRLAHSKPFKEYFISNSLQGSNLMSLKSWRSAKNCVSASPDAALS